jgi:predicted GNAT family N-acyltransferase
MASISFKVIPLGSSVYQEAVLLREEILRQPLGLRFSAEELENEKDHIQIVGILNNEVIATAVLVPEGNMCKMQRVVVKDSFQNQGIGSQLLRFCEDHARSLGFKAIYCHARDSAVEFYLNNHYTAEGEYFDEDTIPHLKMVTKLYE